MPLRVTDPKRESHALGHAGAGVTVGVEVRVALAASVADGVAEATVVGDVVGEAAAVGEEVALGLPDCACATVGTNRSQVMNKEKRNTDVTCLRAARDCMMNAKCGKRHTLEAPIS